MSLHAGAGNNTLASQCHYTQEQATIHSQASVTTRRSRQHAAAKLCPHMGCKHLVMPSAVQQHQVHKKRRKTCPKPASCSTLTTHLQAACHDKR
eukprot:1161472-Pelagomonas_calceolata.AAC.13